MRERYPPLEPTRSGFLQVGKLHHIYWEESGNPQGKPVLFLHGGPGSGTDPSHRCFFDPQAYRIFLFDQRGCGKSTPHAELRENTTWDLVEDIERLREMFGVKEWVVFGGSWGSALALTYAISYPRRVLGLIVRGIFLGMSHELQWFYQKGVSLLFPDRWEKYLAPIPVAERGDLISAYHKRLTCGDEAIALEAARAWSGWEGGCLRLRFDPQLFAQFTDSHRALAIARIECHYFINRCFFPTDNWILSQAHRLKGIPGRIIHGRYDVVCPLDNAWQLHKVWLDATLEIIPDAGHAAGEAGIQDALIRATDAFRGALK